MASWKSVIKANFKEPITLDLTLARGRTKGFLEEKELV
jgi:hypothetical protein